jgi:hypothetical protein
MNAALTDTPEGRRTLFILEAMGGLFEAHFDNGWFLNILEKMSFSSVSLREIRTMISLKEIYETDIIKLENGIDSLREFIGFVEKYVQPILREELGISGFRRGNGTALKSTNDVVKEFFLYTFPHNLARLNDLYGQLAPMIYMLKGLGGLREPAPQSLRPAL